MTGSHLFNNFEANSYDYYSASSTSSSSSSYSCSSSSSSSNTNGLGVNSNLHDLNNNTSSLYLLDSNSPNLSDTTNYELHSSLTSNNNSLMMSKTECSMSRYSSIDESNYLKSFDVKSCKAEAPCEIEFINSMKANASMLNTSSSPASTSSSASSSINQYQNQICFYTPVTHSQFQPDEFVYKQTDTNTMIQPFVPQKIARAPSANKPQIRYPKQTYNLNSNVFTNESLLQKRTQSPQASYNVSKKNTYLVNSNNLSSAVNTNNLSGSCALVKKENLPFCPNDGRFEQNKPPKCSYPNTNTIHPPLDENGGCVDVMSNFMPKHESSSNLFDDLPDLEDLMSLVTFEAPSVSSNSFFPTQSDFKLAPPDFISSSYQMCTNLSSVVDTSLNQNGSNVTTSFVLDSNNEHERTSRSAPQSPLTPHKKQRIEASVSLHKTWSKMNDEERYLIADYLTKTINNEMGRREQLEIIRILNPDAKLNLADTKFAFGIFIFFVSCQFSESRPKRFQLKEEKIIDDEKFKRIKDVMKLQGLVLNEKQINESELNVQINCVINKRELRIKRAHQRLKTKQKKYQRQMLKESKSELFSLTEIVSLKKPVLTDEDFLIDILNETPI